MREQLRARSLVNARTLQFHTQVTLMMLEATCAMPALERLYPKQSALTLHGLVHWVVPDKSKPITEI